MARTPGKAVDGHLVVDESFDAMLDLVFNEWEDNLRRWRDGD